MKTRFAPKFLTALVALGAVLAASAPASAWGDGPYAGPGPSYRPAPPQVYRGPPVAHPHAYGPPRHWGWRHHRRPPPPWAYGYRW